MGLGDDISEVFAEVGSKIKVYKYSNGETYEEYIDAEINFNERSSYMSSMYLSAVFAYNTNADSGDLISFIDNNIDYYLFIASAKERFAGELITKEAALLKTNAIVQIRRKTENRNNYQLQTTWPIIYSGEYAHFTGDISTMEMNNEDYGWAIIDRNLLYMSANLDVRNEDRCVIKSGMNVMSGEAYEIELVEKHKFPGVKICRVAAETRESATHR